MDNWFTVDSIDNNTYIISEYKHWEQTHAYLLNGDKYSLLIDTGLGIENIYNEVVKLTAKPIIVVATHIHWDHIGGHKYFDDFYVHQDEAKWVDGEFPLPLSLVKEYVKERCDLPKMFNIDDYQIFQGTPKKLLKDMDVIDIGGRCINVIHTPGHSPGHMCFYEKNTQYLFTGDLVYKGMLIAYFPSTDPEKYLESINKIAQLPIKKVFPAHHDLDISVKIIDDIKDAMVSIKKQGKLKHGSGVFEYNNFSIWI